MSDPAPIPKEERPAPPSGRWAGFLFLAIPAALLLALGGLWLARVPVLEWALPRLAATQDIPLHALTISRADLGRIELLDVALPGLAIRRAILVLEWDGPLHPRLREAEVSGIESAITLNAARQVIEPSWLAELLAPAPVQDTNAITPFFIPSLPLEEASLRNATLDIALPEGAVTVNLGAALTRGLEGLPEGRLELQGTALGEPLRAEIDLTPRHGPSGPILALGLSGRLGSGAEHARINAALTLTASANPSGGWSPEALSGPLRLAVDVALGPIARLLGNGMDAEGRLTFDLTGTADAPIQALIERDLSQIRQLDMTLETEGTASRLDMPDLVQAQDLSLSGTLEASLGERWLRAANPVTLAATELNGAILDYLPDALGLTGPQRDVRLQIRNADLNLEDALRPTVSGEIWLDSTLANLRLYAPQAVSIDLVTQSIASGNLRGLLVAKGLMGLAGTASLTFEDLTADAQNLRGDVTADLEMSVPVGALSRPLSVIANLRGQVSRVQDALSIALDPKGVLRFPALDLQGGISLRPVEGAGLLRIREGATGHITLNLRDPLGSLTADLPLRPVSILLRGADPEGAIRIDSGTLTLNATVKDKAVSLKSARISSQARGLALDGLDGLVRQSGDAAEASLSADSITQHGERLLQGSAVLTASARGLDTAAPNIDAKLTGADGKVELSAKASLGRTPKLTFRLAPLQFDPQGLQPSAISPQASGLTNVVGEIKAEGSMTLGDKPSGRVDLDLTGIGMDAGPGRLSALTGRISFDLANPPATLPNQTLGGLMEVGGVLAGPMDLTYAIRPDGGLDIASLNIPVLNGSLSLANTPIPPDANRIATEINVNSVDLGSILKLVDLEGLTGQGTLSGVLPVRYENGAVAIAEGRLQSDGPGRISYRGGALDEQLSASNASVDLLLQALQDFRYDSLAVRVNKATNGLGRLGLTLEGSNPAVLDGYPFRLNINLDSDFDRLSGFLLLGFAATEDVLRWVTGQNR